MLAPELRAAVSFDELAARWAADAAALDLSADLHRAELRYEAGRALTLEQTPQGWRITGLR